MKKNYLSVTWVVVVLAILCQAAWGSAFPLIKKGYRLFSISGVASPLLFGGIRFIIAGLILFIVLIAKNRRFPSVSRRDLGNLLVLGTVQSYLVYVFEYIALTYCTGASSAIVNSVQPFFLTLIACYMFRTEKMTFLKILGISLGFTGIIICYMGEAFGQVTFLGEGFMIISSSLFALGANIAKRLVTNSDTLTTTAYNLLIGGIELSITGLAFGGRMTNGGVLGYGIILGLAMISAFSFMIWTALSKYNHMSRIAPYQFVNPISGVVCSALLLGEDLFKIKYLFTLVLVSIGIIITNSAEKGDILTED
ncbi:MAG TPA: hypothetical protein DCP98_08840 [Sphaerochaeta sp.]|nr:hypothetical protein [Sphaerochaeta sp.]